MLLFDKKEMYADVNKKDVIELIRAAFSQRRKVLSNAIKTYLSNRKISQELVREELEKKGKQYMSQRAEQLSLEDYIFLYNAIKDIKEIENL